MRRLTGWLATVLIGAMGSALTSNGQQTGKPTSRNVEHRNNQYGFCLRLPQDWEGYSVLLDEWHGTGQTPEGGYAEVARGPLITIRHPKWAPPNSRQDIPIMVFTLAQWRSVSFPLREFWVSNTPVPPSELGHNRKYVFALDPRYNYALPEGWEEVDRIVRSRSLHAPCRSK